ncbi:hypothetical protein GE21DRAFT_6081 [Neurospora crassa]|uniref:Peptide hydrolase n=2 Tax=Neurospora crassa TaxID=5141 RepID=Q7RZ44_NEUCR|nr:leupeptin-inactivating enzyme 1 [Neurospora crassa OR74A]EAA28271.1 leupeptin-inactivating enzyme 1 [Neurospora crassa OR74A]KHE88583.1 hypothetical protein GE21DRAFT_6081 [Neurospora crassa]CAF06016.1 related to aminopeptidase Y precursor, vacuolar [Neurospora crassa]|eukprot:XP_957507.1 leupeptin-inactivating enzyme 1 [Neurospora crassa OR74A]
MRTAAASLATLALAVPALAATIQGGPTRKPYVCSDALQYQITEKDIRAGAQKLQDIANANNGTRVFGSTGHNATVDFLYNTLKDTGYYDVYKQPFVETYSAGTGSLSVNGKALDVRIMTYTPAGSATGPIVYAEGLGCSAAEYPAEASGNIVLVSRGNCTFGQKALSAKEAGAVGLVIYNNVDGSLSGTLGEAFKDYAPVVGLSKEDGEALIASIKGGEEIKAEFKVDAVTEHRVSFNVIAETKGGDHNNVLIVGGHSDSVAAGPGINDDGSGVIGILTVAKALAKFQVKNAVRFGFWSAEEFGLLGSEYYVKSLNGSKTELAKIRAYLNFDMIASPNYIYGIYDGDGSAFNLTGPQGSDVIEKDFEQFFSKNKVASVPSEFNGRSDYAAFIENGIPSGGIFTGAEGIKTEAEAAAVGGTAGIAYDVNYHQAGDTIDNIAWDAFLLNTRAIANSVAKYARSFKSLPAINLMQRRWDGDVAQTLKRNKKRANGAHVHSHSGPCGGGEEI